MTQAWTAGRALSTARPARPQSRAMARAVRLTSRFAVVTAAVAAVAGAALAVRDPVSGLDRWYAFTAVIYLPVVLVGAAMLGRQPPNPVGWIFLVSGWSLPVSTALHLIGVVDGRARAALGIVSSILFVLGVPLAALFGVLLFPDGRLAAGGAGARVDVRRGPGPAPDLQPVLADRGRRLRSGQPDRAAGRVGRSGRGAPRRRPAVGSADRARGVGLAAARPADARRHRGGDAAGRVRRVRLLGGVLRLSRGRA